MNCFFGSYRHFCRALVEPLKKQASQKEKLDFGTLKYNSKVQQQSIKRNTCGNNQVSITSKTIHLLERLSLVNLDGQEALQTLRSSIHFAENITKIDTNNIEPLYIVLHEQSLRLRFDNISEGDCRDDILQNAKVTDEDYFVSPPGNIPLQQENSSF